jgi:hypothetical protein
MTFLRTNYIYVDFMLNSLVTHNFKTSIRRNIRFLAYERYFVQNV